jgi:hypothetical protein
MDLVAMQLRLDQAQAAVRLAAYNVRQQRIKATQLEQEGPEHESAAAESLLTTLVDCVARHVADRDRVVRELVDFDLEHLATKYGDGVDYPR